MRLNPGKGGQKDTQVVVSNPSKKGSQPVVGVVVSPAAASSPKALPTITVGIIHIPLQNPPHLPPNGRVS